MTNGEKTPAFVAEKSVLPLDLILDPHGLATFEVEVIREERFLVRVAAPDDRAQLLTMLGEMVHKGIALCDQIFDEAAERDEVDDAVYRLGSVGALSADNCMHDYQPELVALKGAIGPLLWDAAGRPLLPVMNFTVSLGRPPAPPAADPSQPPAPAAPAPDPGTVAKEA